MKKLAIVGIGNILRKDDGIGCFIANKLQAADLPSYVTVLELGLAGVQIAHDIEGFERVIFIDAANMGLHPGDIKLFSPDEVSNNKELDFMHNSSIFSIIEYAKIMNVKLGKIEILGIEPKSIDYGNNLSKECEKAKDKAIHLLTEVINNYA